MRQKALPIMLLLMGILFGWGQTAEAQSDIHDALDRFNGTPCEVSVQWVEWPRLQFNPESQALEFDGSYPQPELSGSPRWRMIDWHPNPDWVSVVYIIEPSNEVLRRTGFGTLWEAYPDADCDASEMGIIATDFAQIRAGLNDVGDSGLVAQLNGANVLALLGNYHNYSEQEVVDVIFTQQGFGSESQVREAYRNWDASN